VNLSSATETTPEALQEGASAPLLLSSSRSTPPRILVTGCAGFIGARVCELLLAAGHDVTGLDSLNDAYDIRLKQWRLARLVNRTGFQFHQLDIAERMGSASSALERLSFDAVINLAARAGVRYSVENPWVYYEANTIGTLNLLEFCRARGIGKFVLASSSSLYGDDSPLPFREDTNTDRPLSPYAASKKAAETLCYTYHALYDLDVTVFRYFTVYGPAGRPDMMPFRLVQWISEGRPVTVYGDGTQSRDFTYVDDIARGTIAGLQPLGYEIINLGSDRPAKLMDLIRMVEEQVGRKAALEHKPRHPADVTATWADISKARRLLGWQPETTLQDGIARLVAWYRSERDWASNVNTA
jgi:UDP-glucuronate 4-epimerase